MMVMAGDLAARALAPADAASRVTARIWKSAFWERSALMTLPPCFPVAPVMRSARDIVLSIWLVSGLMADEAGTVGGVVIIIVKLVCEDRSVAENLLI